MDSDDGDPSKKASMFESVKKIIYHMIK